MSLLASLRLSTSASHQRLEEAVDIEGAVNDRTEYTRILRKFFGFYAPLEKVLAETQTAAGLCWPPSPCSRTEWLAEDLRALGVNPSEVPLCQPQSLGARVGPFIGTTYVVEGAALGGQVIVRSIREKGLGVPVRFFAGNGENTATRWKSFIAWAEGQPLAGDEREAACSAAVDTFETLTVWMKNT